MKSRDCRGVLTQKIANKNYNLFAKNVLLINVLLNSSKFTPDLSAPIDND